MNWESRNSGISMNVRNNKLEMIKYRQLMIVVTRSRI